MHAKLSKPPVMYVLAQVNFTSIEKIPECISQLQDRIRDIFPHYQEINIQGVQLNEVQQPKAVTLTQWHFMDKEKHMGIILDKQSIAIHTSHYDQFQPLLDSFKKVAAEFHEILHISLYTRMGLRYINIIEDGLKKVDRGLQGFQLMGAGFSDNQFLTKTETTQRSQEGVVKIQTSYIGDRQVIGDAQNIFFMPPELVNTAKFLSFKHYIEPKKDFLVLDVDHFSNGQDDFNLADILIQFHRLQEVVYQVFCQAVGQQNLQDWA